jgi:ABC-type transport system involved in Fe-S cluster assembly fused permease/ATPase subunit
MNMGRAIVSIVVGVVVWFVVATLGNWALRAAWPDYAAVERAMTFTLPMLLSRLVLGVVSSLAAGGVTAAIARGTRRPVQVLAAVMVLLFLPVHYTLWTVFPWWYHAAFLVSLPVFVLFGAGLSGTPRTRA